MSLSASPTLRVFTISLPEELASQVEEVARRESRDISELFREAFRAYRLQRARRTIDQIQAEVSRLGPSPYSEADIEGFVDEARAEMAAQRKQ